MNAHPDEELLNVCLELTEMQRVWQAFWHRAAGTPEDSPEDAALDRFAENIWPGGRRQLVHPDHPDLPGRLMHFTATTADGLRAKAAAVLAIWDCGSYADYNRDDAMDLMRSVVRDAAGTAYRPVGHAAAA